MKTKSASQSAFFRPRVLIGVFLCAVAACSMVTGTLLAFFRAQGTAKVSNRTLTFEERVSYQRAIEEVYWRHRIWPKERPDPKPALNAVMSQAQLEKKVADYLHNSKALENSWQRPITAEQLQAEMERMAKQTRQPDVLRELFEALGNDPFVIAECLARPALAERLITNWYAYDQRVHGELKQRAEAELQAHPSADRMKQLSGKDSEIEFMKSDSPREGAHHSPEHGVKLTSREWEETVQELATTFDAPHSVRPVTPNYQVSALRSAHSTNATAKHETLPIGKLSPLQEDEVSPRLRSAPVPQFFLFLVQVTVLLPFLRRPIVHHGFSDKKFCLRLFDAPAQYRRPTESQSVSYGSVPPKKQSATLARRKKGSKP